MIVVSVTTATIAICFMHVTSNSVKIVIYFCAGLSVISINFHHILSDPVNIKIKLLDHIEQFKIIAVFPLFCVISVQ